MVLSLKKILYIYNSYFCRYGSNMFHIGCSSCVASTKQIFFTVSALLRNSLLLFNECWSSDNNIKFFSSEQIIYKYIYILITQYTRNKQLVLQGLSNVLSKISKVLKALFIEIIKLKHKDYTRGYILQNNPPEGGGGMNFL